MAGSKVGDAEQDGSGSDRERNQDAGVPGDRESYVRPQEVRDPAGERADGRPTGTLDEDGLRPGIPSTSAPTEAVEEEGALPTTEHAPGGDL